MIVGYARVSTDGQSLKAQHSALQAAGAERVFAEKQSGVKTDRAALARCLRGLAISQDSQRSPQSHHISSSTSSTSSTRHPDSNRR